MEHQLRNLIDLMRAAYDRERNRPLPPVPATLQEMRPVLIFHLTDVPTAATPRDDPPPG